MFVAFFIWRYAYTGKGGKLPHTLPDLAYTPYIVHISRKILFNSPYAYTGNPFYISKCLSDILFYVSVCLLYLSLI